MNEPLTVPEASVYSLDRTGSVYSFTTPSTSLYVTSSYDIDVTGTTIWAESNDGDNLDDCKYVKRRHGAIRLPKKTKGSVLEANHPRHRIKNLLKPIVVFKYVKDRFKIIERRVLSARLERVAQMLESTKVTNQIALREKIEEKFSRFLREQEMIACGFDKYLEKEILQAFVDSVKDKIIKITPVKNYVRLIPKDVRKRMETAEKKKLFDDFVIIHCDPENKAVEKTQEEKKDPILCGVIRQSPRYYFVGDWKDELCDLTMDSVLEHLGLDEDEVTLPEDVETALMEIL